MCSCIRFVYCVIHGLGWARESLGSEGMAKVLFAIANDSLKVTAREDNLDDW